MAEADYQKIKAACLKLLGRREYSQQELQNKLSLKGFCLSDIEYMIAELKQQDLQSDERFAESYVKSRLLNGVGPLKIQYELALRGIKDFDINAVVVENFAGWDNLLLQVYQHKYPNDLNLTAKEKFKRISFLRQRGFTNSMINKLFKQLAPENPDI